MKNNKILGMLLWAIGLLAAHLIIFVVPDSYTTTIWITYGFTIFTFLSQLVLWLWIWHNEISAPEQFLHTPVLTISVVYLLLQLVADLIFAMVMVSVKITVLFNMLLAIVVGVMLILSLIAKNSIERIDKRQRNRRIEL